MTAELSPVVDQPAFTPSQKAEEPCDCGIVTVQVYAGESGRRAGAANRQSAGIGAEEKPGPEIDGGAVQNV
jgi:hypothetical protein